MSPPLTPLLITLLGDSDSPSNTLQMFAHICTWTQLRTLHSPHCPPPLKNTCLPHYNPIPLYYQHSIKITLSQWCIVIGYGYFMTSTPSIFQQDIFWNIFRISQSNWIDSIESTLNIHYKIQRWDTCHEITISNDYTSLGSLHMPNANLPPHCHGPVGICFPHTHSPSTQTQPHLAPCHCLCQHFRYSVLTFVVKQDILCRVRSCSSPKNTRGQRWLNDERSACSLKGFGGEVGTKVIWCEAVTKLVHELLMSNSCVRDYGVGNLELKSC